jgi:pimeloyl-ACP methyl ester carboxylesterase
LDEIRVLERLEIYRRAYAVRQIAVDGHVWSYRRTGTGGDPVVLLPGIEGGGSVFFEVALMLEAELELLMVTAPPMVALEALVDGHAAFLRAIGSPRVRVVGSSLGGYLAQALALRHRALVAQLFLVNTFIDPTPLVSTLPPATVFEQMPAVQVAAKTLEPLLSAPALDAGQRAMRLVMRELVGKEQPVEDFKARVLTLLGGPPLERAGLDDANVVVVDDDHDLSIPHETRAAVRERYRGARQYVIDRGGHLPAIQRPHALAMVLRDALSRE